MRRRSFVTEAALARGARRMLDDPTVPEWAQEASRRALASYDSAQTEELKKRVAERLKRAASKNKEPSP